MSIHPYCALAVSAFFYGNLSSQCEPEGRYRDFIFPGFVKTADMTYGANLDKDGEMLQLTMDVYVPQGDVATDRALVVICHGGYFLYGDKAEVDVVPFCEDLSRMGYVVASINYRMGIEFETPLNEPYGRTLVRAVQDLRAAIRWFRKDVAEGDNQFGINPEEIYTGGISAGGFMALHTAYLDETEIPDFIDMNGIGINGSLDGESGSPGYSSDVNAIFNISGAIGDTAWIDPGDTTPACLFHGDNDQTVPFGSDMFYLFGLVEVTDLDGSHSIDERMNQLGIEHCFERNEGMGHVPYLGNPEIYDTTLSIISNFLSHYICGVELDCGYREIQNLVNLTEPFEPGSLFLYPNPATDWVRINGSGRTFYRNARLCDSTGRPVKNISLVPNQVIDVSGFSPGIYLLYLEGDLPSRVMTLVVQ